MGVYIYQSGTEKEMKNAYIGEVVKISSDLRGATLAGLQAQGWDNISASDGYTLDFTGLHTPGVTNSIIILYKYISNLNSSNKITFSVTGYATRNWSNDSYRYNSYFMAGLFSNSTASNDTIFKNSISGTYSASGSTQPFKTGIIYYDSSSAPDVLAGGNSYSNTAGNVEYNVSIDLSTGVITYNLTSPKTLTNATATLTSSQLNSLLTNKYVGVVVGPRDKTNSPVLYTVDLTVE